MDRCEDCRHVRPPISKLAGHECAVLGRLSPVSYMRRTDGLCGPASKLWEPAHKPQMIKDRRVTL